MLDEIKLRAIDLLVGGEHSKVQVAKICGRSRQWLYDILDDAEVMAEIDKRLHQVQNYGENVLKATLQDRLNDIMTLAKTAESEKIRLDANIYLTNRVLGNTTTKVDITAASKAPEQVDFDAELDDIEMNDIETDDDTE